MRVNTNKENTLIVGAGGAGKELFQELKRDEASSKKYEFEGFIDDDITKKGTYVLKLPILGTIDDIPKILKQQKIKTLFIAIPSGSGALVRRIINKCKNFEVKIKIVPRISEVLTGALDISYVREIEPVDLLGRSIVRHDFSDIRNKLHNKSVFVFGAAGSIGSKLAEQIAGLTPKKLVCIDWWENGMFDLQQRLEKIRVNPERESAIEIDYVIANIQDKEKIEKLIVEHKPDVIFNAAAYKHVPLMESNSCQAVNNNILGTKNLFELSIKHNVGSFILISTDKAVNPTSVMGATKRVTEKMMHYYASKTNKTLFSAVRFGNVLNSNGSVIPLFKKQIEEGMVTVTHKDIMRYFMTIDEAVQLILQCWVFGGQDKIFVLDMGEPIKILDLAKLMIRLSGKEPGKDVKIKFIGLRPGEKLYEEPLTKIEKTTATMNQKIFILQKDEEFDKEQFMEGIQELIEKCKHSHGCEETKERLKELIPTYKELSYPKQEQDE